MSIKTNKWDASEYLDSPEMICEYLRATIEEGDTDLLMIAIGNVAKARGMTDIAQKTDLNRQNLYKALSGSGSPKFDTIAKVLRTFGLKITIVQEDEVISAA